MGNYDTSLMEYDPEMEMFEYDEFEWEGEAELMLSEADEMELAAELLEVNSEEELDLFLGKVINTVGKAAGKFVKPSAGKAIGRALKGVTRKVLPLAGGALGGYFGGPLGAKVGSSLASAAGKALGLELEMMSPEDVEFEGARQFVRLAADTVKKAASAAPNVPPRAAAKKAVISAVKKHAPELLRKGTGVAAAPGRTPSGRWIRKGRNIIILNS